MKTYPSYSINYKGTYAGDFEEITRNWFIGDFEGEKFLIKKDEKVEIFRGYYKYNDKHYEMSCFFM